MTIPRRLSLQRTADGIRLIQRPVVARDQPPPAVPDPHSFRLQIEAPAADARDFRVRLLAGNGAATLIGYDARRQELFVDRTRSGLIAFSPDFPARTAAPLVLGREPLRLDILVDRCSIEVFAQDGRIAMTNLVFPPPDARGIEFWPHRKGTVRLTPMRSIW